MDNYNQAIRKHGIATTIGGFSTVLSITALLLENIGQDVTIQVATDLSIIAGLSTFTSNRYLDYQEAQNAPVAYIYDTFNLAKLKKKDLR